MKKLGKASMSLAAAVSAGDWTYTNMPNFSTTPLEMVEHSLSYKIRERHDPEDIVVAAYNLALDMKAGLPEEALDSLKDLARRHIKGGTFAEGVEELKGLLVLLMTAYR